MRPPFLLVVLLLSQGLDGELADYSDYDSSDIYGMDNFTIDDGDVNSHLQIQATLQHFQECRDKKWSCDRDCRLEFRQKTTKCHQPFPHDKCFGIPINYKYTRDHNIGRFPIELGVLSRYPRCWSYLGPLICATVFRPCSRHHFIERERDGSIKNGTIELWQLLGSSMCEKAVQMCDEVISSGLFPSFIRCKDVNNNTGIKNRPIYSDKCQHSIDDYPVKVDDGACPWPLVSESSSFRIDLAPLLDDCYLPCRSPLVSPPLSDRFRAVRFFVCTLLTILFFSESIFLSRFCKLFTEHISLFYISHAVICVATYCLIWSLSYFDTFFTLSECSIGGVSRRFALSHSIFEWCSIQSVILYASFLAAFIWLLLLYVDAICPSTMISFYFSPRSFRIRSRLFLISCVYGVSVIVSFFVMSRLRENDGVSGVCHNGMVTWWKYFASIFPLVCIASILISLMLIISLKRREIMNRLALRHALAELNGSENQEFAEHIPRFKMDGDAIFAHVPGAVNGPLSIDMSCARENQGLLREDPHQQMFWSVYNRSQRLVSERLCRQRNSGISIRWTGASFMLFMLFLIVSPLIHYHFVALPARHEEESIVDYITCHVAHTIRNRSVEWITQNVYPSPNSHDASWCSLPLKDARDRLEGILVVFVILPVLPFLVLLMAFLAGLNGYGGFGKKHVGGSEFTKMPIDRETCEAIPMKPVVVHESDIEASLSPSLRDTKASFMEAVNETQNKLQTESHDVEIGDSTSVAEGDSESRKEYQEEFMNIINKIRDELAFQQSMLVTDSAAWNISLFYMRRIEQLLSKLRSSDIKVDRIFKELKKFGDEMSRVMPSVSSHVMQLSRWMDSVRETCLDIEHLRSDPNEQRQCPVGPEDIFRQQELIALNDYIMRMAASTSSHHEPPQTCTTSVEGSTVKQESVKSDPLPAEQVKVQPTEQMCTVSREHMQNQDSIEDQQPGPSRSRENAPEMVSPADRRAGVPANENVAVSSQQSGRTRQILRISAYAESYSATPQGILTRLTVPELRIRVQQIRNICAGDSLYPQELSYMLLVTGDITFGGNTAREDLHLYTMEQLPSIFGANVPSIDARIGVQDFLVQMRRRALCVVAAIGYHFSLHHRRGLEYTPPVLPPLGLYRSENELILRRVLGDNDDVLPSLRGFLQEFQFGRGPVVPRLDLRFATAFRNYLCLVAAREGFDNNIEEYVPDPDPPQEPSNSQADVDDSDEDNDPDF